MREWQRMPAVLERFIAPMLAPGASVLSIGCGGGADVVALREMGFDAWGMDASRVQRDDLPEEFRDFIVASTLEADPFGGRQFDFAYAFDVIEHVGCRNWGTRLLPNAREQRVGFLTAAFNTVKPGGALLLTTSNRLCPFDVGHGHRYHWLGNRLAGHIRGGLAIPWHPENFLVSADDTRSLLDEGVGRENYVLKLEPVVAYPGISNRKGFVSALARAGLSILDLPPLRGSVFAPVLVMYIHRLH
ncbi:MAG: class I SAM-dependent methyltransferase [Gammaproteobacteria bacterium]